MSNDLVAPNGVADSEPAADLAAAAATDLAAPAAPDAAPTVPETAIVAAAPEIAAPDAPPEPSFDDMGLHPDIRTALDDMGYFRPTAVQATVFRPVAEGKDLLVQSRTGTGKTAAFGLPLLNRLVPAQATPQALILAPTRELALQVSRELAAIGKHRGIIIETLYGGAPIGKQIAALRQGVHVVVGTPGRVLDHIGRRTLDTKTISTFILDECDEMLSMGFLEDIERVVSHLPEKRQTLLFSATMPDEVHRYSRRHMRSPEQIKLSSGNISVEEIHHAYYVVSGIGRARDLLKLLFSEEPESAIIFCNMRDETTAVAKFLQRQGLDAEALSSDLSQSDRERVMGRMKAHNLRFLVATDVAARGIDISNLSHVINYSFPESPEVYVHRTGRTGRAGKRGVALSLVGPRDLGPFWLLKLTYKLKPEERDLPPETIFEGKLKHPLPPLGAPKPPDPLSILVRGVPGAVTDLERGIFDKMVANPNGRRVLARLMADKLSELTTKTRPKTERPARVESTEGVEAEAPRERSFRDDRPPREGGDRFRDRGDRFRGRDGEGPRGRDDGFRGRSRDDRPRDAAAGPVDGPREGGDRPPREGGDRFRDRGDRDRFRDDRPRDASAAPADAPREGGDRPPREGGDRFRDRGDRDRNRDDRPRDAAAAPADAPREGGDRPPREGGDRFRDRGDRDRNRDDRPRDASAAPADAPREGGDRPPREGGDRFRDRGDRDRNRDDRPRDAAAAPVDGPREGGDRPPREGGDRFRDRGDRDRNRDDRFRDRGRNRDDRPRDAAPDGGERPPVAESVTPPPAEPVVAVAEAAAREPNRENDDRARDRHRDRDGRRDRQQRDEQPVAAAAPAAVSEPAMATVRGDTQGLPAAPAPAPESRRADRDRAGNGAPSAKAEAPATKPAEAKRGGQEFWETWADQKATRPAPAPAPAPVASEPATEPASEERGKSGRRSRSKDGHRAKADAKPDSEAKAEPAQAKTEAKTDAKTDAKADAKPASKAKREAHAEPAKKADAKADDDGEQVRLFVSLGKKHGITADSLREILAGSDKAKIGSVMLRDTHANVRVPAALAERIITKHNGTTYEGNAVTVERAR